ncbi:MAG TPA: ABC transporter substrate-binding protein [Acetobacteraceae bacterium]
MSISRRLLLAGAGAAALPRFAIAQNTSPAGDDRPEITIAVAKISNSGVLDPLREQSSNASERWLGSIQETLIARNQQGRLERVPGLATNWRRIDETTVELSLRPGVKLHNGDTLTAEDVAFSFGPERMFGGGRSNLPADIPAVARRHWPHLARVEVVDRLTVRFVNATPDVTMEGRISAGGSEICSRRAWTENGDWQANSSKLVGTGPYKLREFRPDASLTLDAHDEYWGGRPPIKTLRFLEVPEAASRINGLRSGEYQFACDVQPDAIDDIEVYPGIEVLGGLVLNHRIITFDKHHPALVDPRVRLAMAHAIDGRSIVDTLWDGRARVPPGLQWEFYGDMFVKGWTVPPYDPAAARELLNDAGYDGTPIPYRIRKDYYPEETATAEVVTECWKLVGLNTPIEVKENWAQVLDKAGPRGVRDWSNSAVFDDPVSSIVNQHGPNGAQQQDGEWTNAEMNTLSGVLESGTDVGKRKQAFARMLQICEREDPTYIVLNQNAVFTAKRRELPWRQPPSFFLDFSPRGWES